MNNPGSILDGLSTIHGNPIFIENNKIMSRLTRMEARHYCPHGVIIDKKHPKVQRFVVNKERLGEFFRANKVTHIFINKHEERMEDKSYRTSSLAMTNSTVVVVNCIVGI